MTEELVKEAVDDLSDARSESVRDLHKVIREHWCDEFEYGESCKHCILEVTLCEPLFEAMYPDFFDEAHSLEETAN